MADEANQLAATLALSRDEPVDWGKAMINLTANVMAQALFGESLAEADFERAVGERDLTAADTGALPHLRSCVDETLRLHPPAWIVDRAPIEDVELDGHLIPAGRVVAVCIYSMHRPPDFWSEPGTFQPGRFLAEDLPLDAYMPFGLGPRKCVGQHFALMEIMLVLAQLLRRFRFEALNAHEVRHRALVTLGPDRPLMVLAHPVV